MYFICLLKLYFINVYSKLFQDIFDCILNNKNIKNVQGK